MSSTHVNGISLWSETQGTAGSPVVLVPESLTFRRELDRLGDILAA